MAENPVLLSTKDSLIIIYLGARLYFGSFNHTRQELQDTKTLTPGKWVS